MRDDFDQPTSGSEKNYGCSQPNKQREFAAYDISKMVSAVERVGWLRLTRHAREDIQSVSALQSSDRGLTVTNNESHFSKRLFDSVCVPLAPFWEFRKRGRLRYFCGAASACVVGG